MNGRVIFGQPITCRP